MNQIPNIEEGVVYEKYWFYAGEWHDAGCAFVCVDHGVCNCHTRKNAKIIKQTHHHQLQKARQDWLREEIVRLDSMLIKEYMKGSPAQYQNKAILEVMKRYHSELDQDKN